MAKKVKYIYDPTIRQELLFSESVFDWEGSLDNLISKFQDIKTKALARDSSFFKFEIGIDSDHNDYSCKFQIFGTRAENLEEKTFRLELAAAQKKAKAEEAANHKAAQIAEVKRLCKKLKVQSPI